MGDNSVEDNSPLQFLDTDCSRYLYETYYPSETQRVQQKRVIQEMLYHIWGYTGDSFKRVLGGGYCNISRIGRQFKAGETGWIWSSISAIGGKVGRKFPIVDNGDGTGYYQFSKDDSRGFVKYLPGQINLLSSHSATNIT